MVLELNQYLQEKFDRLQQETMLEEPDATAFLNAQLRTRRRVS